jgi:hypothetical protein
MPFRKPAYRSAAAPAPEDVRADHPLDLDQVMVLIDRPVVGGDRLGGEERQPGDLAPGELRDHRSGDSRVGPLHLLAQSSRRGSGIIMSRSSIATSTDESDTMVSRNATSEWV